MGLSFLYKVVEVIIIVWPGLVGSGSWPRSWLWGLWGRLFAKQSPISPT